ncbi:MAG: hypothetical protein LBL13_11330 [Bacteroidales bacterium]|jgi:tRNA splicing endonuclease|nr:hypothetical protein [Bacteroidales bacterium]
MSFEKKKKEKSYTYKVRISAKKKRNIEICAKAKGITFNRFIKDAINQSLMESKALISENNDVLRNQLELFNAEDFSKNEIQLVIDL